MSGDLGGGGAGGMPDLAGLAGASFGLSGGAGGMSFGAGPSASGDISTGAFTGGDVNVGSKSTSQSLIQYGFLAVAVLGVAYFWSKR